MESKQGLGAVILRVVLGVIFLGHGVDKFQGGIGETVGFFESLGIPGFLAYVVATIELVGGLALILGLGTKVVSVLFAIILIGAMFSVQFSVGFLDGFAYDLALLAVAIYMILANYIPLSVDNALFKNKNSQRKFTET